MWKNNNKKETFEEGTFLLGFLLDFTVHTIIHAARFKGKNSNVFFFQTGTSEMQETVGHS